MPNSQSSEASASAGGLAPAGTLLWVGDRDLPEFSDAYRYCESAVSQLAYRRDLGDAMRRPADAVRRIVITSPTRTRLDDPLLRDVCREYPAAEAVRLLGPLALGGKRDGGGSTRSQALPWHQAATFLVDWLGPAAADDPKRVVGDRSSDRSRCVAIVAAGVIQAEPLLELAASAGAAAVWCRQPDPFRVRNIEIVWWDESAAPAETPAGWQRRFDDLAGFDRLGAKRHAWCVASPHLSDCRAARDAGVERIVVKPGRIGPLVEMLHSPAVDARGHSRRLPSEQRTAEFASHSAAPPPRSRAA